MISAASDAVWIAFVSVQTSAPVLALYSYDTRVLFNVDCTVECGQLNLALANANRNQKYKKETKTSKRQCPLRPVKSKIREGSSNGIRKKKRSCTG